MCGIVGIIGKENACEIILKGLERLEYRGYDSAGIYVANQETGHLVKAPGQLTNLAQKLTPEITGNIGIGHTRWATHGVPSEENAHPHLSQGGRFVLVHNGVIENHLELQETYLNGLALNGQTDTEIVVNVIETLSEKEHLSAFEAFKKALEEINGSYAFALIDTQDPTKLYIAKNKSPLLIGCGEDCYLVGSDAFAMIHETNRFIELKDGEIGILTPQQLWLEDADGQTIDRAAYTAEVEATDIEKGLYPYYMLKEIEEQPSVIRRLLQTYFDEQHQPIIDDTLIKQLLASERIYIVACGTSYHAGLATKATFEQLTQIPVEVHVASEFAYHQPLLAKKPFFIYLSQSGETADSRQVLVQTNELGAPSLTITNVPGSTLAREATYALSLVAGPEIAVASTKAYTSQVALMTILAYTLGQAKNNPLCSAFDIFHELELAATSMEEILYEKEALKIAAHDFLANQRNTFYIGRGNDYYVALEAALKLKEISYIQAEGFAAGELKHGTIALIEEATPVIGLITDEKTKAHTRGNLQEVKSRGAHVLVIVQANFAQDGDQVRLPVVHPYLTTLTSVVPTQLLAYYATLERGYDVDKPRNLAKSVTVE